MIQVVLIPIKIITININFYLIIIEYSSLIWVICIGFVGYIVTGKFQIIVSIDISSGACHSRLDSFNDTSKFLLVLVTN